MDNTGQRNYLVIVQSGICPSEIFVEMSKYVNLVTISPFNMTQVMEVMSWDNYSGEDILLVGTNLNVLVGISRQLECGVGLFLEDANEMVTFVENGFYFYDWKKELLATIASEQAQRMMAEGMSVRDILLEVVDAKLT